MKMLIALVIALSMLTCLDAHSVQENSLVETEGCHNMASPLLCRISAGIARLVINPARTLRLIKEVIAKLINNFSLKEVFEAMLGAVSVPLSTLIHLPEVIKYAIEGIHTHVLPILKIKLKVIGYVLRVQPLHILKKFVFDMLLLPPYIFFHVAKGIVVALAQSGFPNYQKIIDHAIHYADNLFWKINSLIMHFHCTDIRSPSSCNKIYHAFENIVVNPAFKFLNGLMALVENVFEKLKEVLLPIVDKLSPSYIERYCRMVLSNEGCARFFSYIKEMDEFGKEEVRKVADVVDHVIQWIMKNIFTRTWSTRSTMMKLKVDPPVNSYFIVF